MFGRRKQLNSSQIDHLWPTHPRAAQYMIAYGASPAMVNELIGEIIREEAERVTERSSKCDRRRACNNCGLVRHASDKGRCRRCGFSSFSRKARFESHHKPRTFVDIPHEKQDQKLERIPKRFTYCPRCHGVQPWERKVCNRCGDKVKTFYGKDHTERLTNALEKANEKVSEQERQLESQEESNRQLSNTIDELRPPMLCEDMADMTYQKQGVTHVCDFKCDNSKINEILRRRNADYFLGVAQGKKDAIAAEDKIILLEREIADLKHDAHEYKTQFKKTWENREDSHQRRIQNVRRTAERRAKRELEAVKKESDESKSRGVDTFMGMPVADAAEAMLVADELGRAVDGHSRFFVLAEIAIRFRKLRTPPTPKKAIKGATLLCPECGGLVRSTNPIHGSSIKPFFCPKKSCAWEGEA